VLVTSGRYAVTTAIWFGRAALFVGGASLLNMKLKKIFGSR
jgi:hypothetical protein